MTRIADPLRRYADSIPGGLGGDALHHIADQIDEEHQRRMWQCEHEVRKRLCKDMRWAVNVLEKQAMRGWIRKQIEDGNIDE